MSNNGWRVSCTRYIGSVASTRKPLPLEITSSADMVAFGGAWILLMMSSCCTSHASTDGDCSGGKFVATGPDDVTWQEHANGSSVTVQWGYGNVSRQDVISAQQVGSDIVR